MRKNQGLERLVDNTVPELCPRCAQPLVKQHEHDGVFYMPQPTTTSSFEVTSTTSNVYIRGDLEPEIRADNLAR